MNVSPLVISTGAKDSYPLFIKLAKDRFRYRWNKVPFNQPLKVIAFDFKRVLVSSINKTFIVLWKDCLILK